MAVFKGLSFGGDKKLVLRIPAHLFGQWPRDFVLDYAPAENPRTLSGMYLPVSYDSTSAPIFGDHPVPWAEAAGRSRSSFSPQDAALPYLTSRGPC